MTQHLEDTEEEQQHEHDQLPTVDEILVERSQGKILPSSTTISTKSSATPNNKSIREKICTCRGIICIFVVLAVLTAIVIVSIVFSTASVTMGTATNTTTVYTEEEEEEENLDTATLAIVSTEEEEENENLGPVALATVSTPGVELHYNITQDFLVDQGLALLGGTEFEDKKSYQSRAFKVLIKNGVLLVHENSNNDNDNDQRFEISDHQKLAQRYALLCLFFSTNSVRTDVSDEAFGYGTTPNWHNKDVPSPWKFDWKADECNWSGVVCESSKLITRIELVNHLLTGYLPMELKLLNGGPIEVFDFSNNRGLGEGGFPPVFSEFDSLESIGLQGTGYVGMVPKDLCDRHNIKNIYVDCDNVSCECCEYCSSE